MSKTIKVKEGSIMTFLRQNREGFMVKDSCCGTHPADNLNSEIPIKTDGKIKPGDRVEINYHDKANRTNLNLSITRVYEVKEYDDIQSFLVEVETKVEKGEKRSCGDNFGRPEVIISFAKL